MTYYQVAVGAATAGAGESFEIEVLAGRGVAEEGDRVRIGLRSDGADGPEAPAPSVFSRSAPYEGGGPADGAGKAAGRPGGGIAGRGAP